MAAKTKGKKTAAQAGPRITATLPRHWWAWTLVLLVFVAGALLHVHARLEEVRLGYGLSKAASSNRKLMADRRKLQVEVATLRSPQRLRKLALEKLGLMEPRAEQILHLTDSPRGELALGRQEQ